MSIQATLPSDLWTNFCAMAAEKKPRICEAYPFEEFPLKKLKLKKPEFVTKSVFSIPEMKDTTRMPFALGRAYLATRVPTKFIDSTRVHVQPYSLATVLKYCNLPCVAKFSRMCTVEYGRNKIYMYSCKI